MTKKFLKRLSPCLVSFVLFCSIIFGAYSFAIPNSISVAANGVLPEYPLVSCSASVSSGQNGIYNVDYKLFGMLPLKSVRVGASTGKKLLVGGMPFGIKFATDGIMVVGFCDVSCENGTTKNPAAEAGLKINDMIKKVNGTVLSSASDLTRIVEGSGGKALSVEYTRAGKSYKAMLTPAYSIAEGKYKTGVYVKDGGAGIGTVTYIDPDNYSFGGLGHGVCDSTSGEPIAMTRGSVVDVTISGIVRGEVGKPGEVKGYFSSGKTGSLVLNSECGVFGAFAEAPHTIACGPLEVGTRNELRDGKAYIYCTLDTNKIEKYEVEISSIDRKANGNKCFTVKVTDKALLEKTGGIVQGMSGSPIVQNGKLVGAVTHVLINDPTTGYGIFIENMLNAAEMTMAIAS